MSVCLNVCLYVYMYVCLPACIVCLFVCMHFCMSVCLSVCMSVCIYVCMFVYLSICLYGRGTHCSDWLNLFCTRNVLNPWHGLPLKWSGLGWDPAWVGIRICMQECVKWFFPVVRRTISNPCVRFINLCRLSFKMIVMFYFLATRLTFTLRFMLVNGLAFCQIAHENHHRSASSAFLNATWTNIIFLLDIDARGTIPQNVCMYPHDAWNNSLILYVDIFLLQMGTHAEGVICG